MDGCSRLAIGAGDAARRAAATHHAPALHHGQGFIGQRAGFVGVVEHLLDVGIVQDVGIVGIVEKSGVRRWRNVRIIVCSLAVFAAIHRPRAAIAERTRDATRSAFSGRPLLRSTDDRHVTVIRHAVTG